MSKTICVIGVTGNQGGSVAKRFLQDPAYHVRGVTRDPTSQRAQDLAAQGIEIVQADLNDTESLKVALRGANVIFSVTNYWEPFFRPDCRQEAEAKGISCRQYAYDVELQQGKNIADAAAATVETLDENGFLVSTLSHAGRCSRGAFTELYHFDAKADVFPDYVTKTHSKLASKMSNIQTGYFMTSFKLLPSAYFAKQSDGSFQMEFTTAPDKAVPHLDVNADMGNIVYAVSKRAPGQDYMAEGSTCSWTDFMKTWGQITGQTVIYKQVSTEYMISKSPDKDFGMEVADMFTYSSDPGYDGGMKLVRADDIRKDGIDCPMTTLQDFMKNQDWSPILEQ